MAKPINIPIKATGAEETKEKIKGVGEAAKQFGRQVGDAQGKDRWWMPDEYEAEYIALESLLKDYDRYIKELPEGKKRRQVEEAKKGLSHYLWFAARFGGSLHLWKETGKEHGFEYTRALEALRAMPEEQKPQTGGGKMGQSARPPEPEAVEVTPQIETTEPETVKVKVPVEAAEPETIEVKPQTEIEKPKPVQQQPIINNNYYSYPHYDHSMHYYPSSGDDGRGPRYRQV